MKEIMFEAPFGDERKTVRLTMPDGMDTTMWQVSINWYHQGVIVFRDGRWQGYLNENSELTTEDIQILGEIIDEKSR